MRAVLQIWMMTIAGFLLAGGLSMLGGCTKTRTVASVQEAERPSAPPDTMVAPKDQRSLSGDVPLPQHLREQAAEAKQRGDDNDRYRRLQEHERDAAKPIPDK